MADYSQPDSQRNNANRPNGPRPNGNNRGKMPRFNLTWLYVAIAIALGYLFFTGNGEVS